MEYRFFRLSDRKCSVVFFEEQNPRVYQSTGEIEFKYRDKVLVHNEWHHVVRTAEFIRYFPSIKILDIEILKGVHKGKRAIFYDTVEAFCNQKDFTEW